MDTMAADIVIVGAGLAGFTAAVRASEQGAKVLLIDKSRGELGDGNVLMASGSLRAGGKSPKTAAAELYDFVMSEGVGYPDLVKAWSETCGRAIEWLQSAGVALEESAPGRIWLNQKSEISFGPVYKKERRRPRPHEPQETIFESRRELFERQRRCAAHRRERPRHRLDRQAERRRDRTARWRDDSCHRRLQRQPGAGQEIYRRPRRPVQAARFQTRHRRRLAHGACRRRQDGQSAILLRPLDRAQSAHRRPLLALPALRLFRRRRHSRRREAANVSSTKGAATSRSPTSLPARTIPPARR